LRLSRKVADRLYERVGRHVVLGIRPEHLYLRPIRPDDPAGGASGDPSGALSAPLDVKVGVIEPLGNDMDVYVKTALHDHVVARVEAQEAQSGSAANTAFGTLQADAAATLHADLRKVHLFEPGETGMNLSLETQSVETSSPATEPTHALA